MDESCDRCEFLLEFSSEKTDAKTILVAKALNNRQSTFLEMNKENRKWLFQLVFYYLNERNCMYEYSSNTKEHFCSFFTFSRFIERITFS